MLNINKLNYEIYFIDYIDGSLDKDQEKELFLFLKKNSFLQSEFNLFTNITLDAEKIDFGSKNNLLKNNISNSNSESNFSDLCIARIEGDIPENKITDFDKLVNESGKNKREYQLFLKTLSKANTNISFPDKNILLKSEKEDKSKIRYLFRYSSIAASIIILVSFWFLLPKNIDTNLAESTIQNTTTQILTKQVINQENKQSKVKKKTKSTKKEINSKSLKNKNTNNKKTLHKDVIKSPKHNIIIKINEQFLIAKTMEINSDNHYSSDIAKLKESNLNNLFNEIKNTQNTYSNNNSIKTQLSKLTSHEVRNKLKNINIWNIANAGINGINNIAESNIKFNQKQDSKGKTKEIQLETKYFAFNTPIKK